MPHLINTVVPCTTYNSLPHISEVASAPDHHSQDLHDLQHLRQEHCVPDTVCIRLIHKHYDTQEGEVMMFDKISVPGLELYNV